MEFTRREAIKRALYTSAGLFLANYIDINTFAATQPAKAKSVIQVWLWGGSCHIDTFDPKPDAGDDYTGPLKNPIETNVKGIRIGELLPELAKHADKYSLIRSLTHGNNGHETASYVTQTGRTPGNQVYPSMGAVVSLLKNQTYKGLVPPYIVVTEPQGRFSESGFLGNRYKPFATGGDPNATRFEVEGVIAKGITDERQKQRREFLNKLNTLERIMNDDKTIIEADEAQKKAYDLILGDAGKVFDLSNENDELRNKYGKNTLGQSCLVARRLVEKGVPYVTINYKGWDTHKNHFPIMQKKLPELDKGLSTLIQDLSDKGLLDSTIIWCCGEFGRTPKVYWEAPWNGGRNHHGKVFSALVAGGGFKGGNVIGSSDEKGMEVRDRPVHPVDLLGTMYSLLGIDLNAKLPHLQGKDEIVLSLEKSSGLLKEII